MFLFVFQEEDNTGRNCTDADPCRDIHRLFLFDLYFKRPEFRVMSLLRVGELTVDQPDCTCNDQ